MSAHVYSNAKIFTADARRWAEAIVVSGDRIAYVGDEATATRIAGPDAEMTDLGGATVLPGFVEGHAHIVGTGQAAQQVDLWGANTIAEIQDRVRAWAADNPEAPRVLVQGWAHSAFEGVEPHREILDAVVSNRPVYAQAYDYHSILLNTAALAEVGIDADTASPEGGQIHSDEHGPTGLVDEAAMHRIVWPFLDDLQTEDDRDAYLAEALRAYRETGVTAATDMGLDEADLATLQKADAEGTLTARIAAHWRILPSGDTNENLAQLDRAIELHRTQQSERLRVVGIKVMIDGTVDGCTATLGAPYVDGSNAEPMWSREELTPLVVAADAAGLQVAMHAIGDEAVRIAIDAVEAAVRENGPADRRHRIEHLEVVDQAEVQRLAAIGITASMQPVHSDPAIQDNWRKMLGDHRIDRGFPWPEMTDAGAPLAFGTDSPTSPYAPLPNMFIASTRRSALNPTLQPNLPKYAMPLESAITHATSGSAWASRAEHMYGRIAASLFADFVVLDRDVFSGDPEDLLRASIVRTVVGGRTVFER